MGKARNIASKETDRLAINEETKLEVKPGANGGQKTHSKKSPFPEDLYERAKTNPDIWRSTAVKFKRVADLVRSEVDKDEETGRSAGGKPPIEDVYIFLMSVAIENILKGLLMLKGKSYDEVTKHHRITKLYEDYCESGRTVTEDERRLLLILEHSAVWAGRFNLPRGSAKELRKAYEELGITVSLNDHGETISPSLSKDLPGEHGELNEREKINELYESIYEDFLSIGRSK